MTMRRDHTVGLPGYDAHFTRSGILSVLLVSAVLAACALLAAGCGETTLSGISVRYDEGRMLIDTVFSSETPYSVREEQGGACIVLAAENAALSGEIPAERLIDGIDMISGWFAKSVGDGVEVRFYLTGPYPYADAAANRDGGFGVRITVDEAGPAPVAGTEPEPADTGTSLSRGIAWFHKGEFDSALSALNDAVESDPNCPLAYFYAARIRLSKGQDSKALANLEAALRDSANFTDAVGYKAFTLKRMGDEDGAMSEWRRFVAAAGTLTSGAETITIPESYRELLDDERRQKEAAEQKRRLAEVLEQERAKAAAESAKAVSDSLAVRAEEPVAITAGELPAEDADTIENRIRTSIRRGVYGIVLTLFLLISGCTAVVVWMRRRSRSGPDLTFSGEIDSFMHEREEAGDIAELGEDLSRRVFEDKLRSITGEREEAPGPYPPPPPVVTEPEAAPPSTDSSRDETLHGDRTAPRSDSHVAHAAYSDGSHHFLENSSGRQPITEEIKALVTRMHREGHPVEAICRAADLTRTEVELIIAVRARQVEQIVEEVSEPEDEEYDTDRLNIAIRELRADGAEPREIAKKLGISTSEVHFALSIMGVPGDRK